MQAIFKLLRFNATAILLISLALCCQSNSQTQEGSSGDRVEQRIRTLEKACVLNLRTLNTAQVTYWGGDEAKGFARKLSQLGPDGEGLLDESMVSGERDGYRFRLIIPADVPDGTPIRYYKIIAQPIKRLSKHQRSYYTDETGVIRFTELDHDPTSSDPPLDGER